MLRAVLVTPLTGPLARYGHAGAAALRLWAQLEDVRLEVCDAHPDAAATMRTAISTGPDLVFGPYGSGPAVAAAGAAGRLMWNHGGATTRLASRAVVNVPAPAASYFQGALEAVRAADPGARRVVLLHAGTGFGREVAAGADEAASRLGFAATAVELPRGGAAQAVSRLPAAEVVGVVAGFDDEVEAARALLDATGRRAVVLVAAGVEEVLAALGDAREGLIGPAQWLASAAPGPDEGPDARWLVRAYRRATGTDPPYPAAQAFAAGVVAARCLRDAGAGDDKAVFTAASRLRCTTLFGAFRLDADTGLQAGHKVLTVQWQNGARRVVWPPQRAERPLRYPRSRPTG
ncbi:hypothetical protein BH20ACT9_BH20ACT9_07210 [soil metagenome]